MTDTTLTRLTVNLVPAAFRALEMAADFEKLSRTDAVNRALQVYSEIVGAALLGSGVFVFEAPDGGQVEIIVRRPRRRRWWRR